MCEVSIVVLTEKGISSSDVLRDTDVLVVTDQISSYKNHISNLTGLIFVNNKGKVLQTHPPYSNTRIDSIAKVITGYYDE